MSEYDRYWLKNMIERVKESDDPTELIEAINSHPAGLLADEQIREVIIESLKGNHLKRGRGRSSDLDRNSRIWTDMKVLTHEANMSIEEASRVVEAILQEVEEEKISNREKVGQEFAVTAERIRKLYREERKRRGTDDQARKGEK